jgi:hypothetical protein
MYKGKNVFLQNGKMKILTRSVPSISQISSIFMINSMYFSHLATFSGVHDSVVVKALCYKP